MSELDLAILIATIILQTVALVGLLVTGRWRVAPTVGIHQLGTTAA